MAQRESQHSRSAAGSWSGTDGGHQVISGGRGSARRDPAGATASTLSVVLCNQVTTRCTDVISGDHGRANAAGSSTWTACTEGSGSGRYPPAGRMRDRQRPLCSWRSGREGITRRTSTRYADAARTRPWLTPQLASVRAQPGAIHAGMSGERCRPAPLSTGATNTHTAREKECTCVNLTTLQSPHCVCASGDWTDRSARTREGGVGSIRPLSASHPPSRSRR